MKYQKSARVGLQRRLKAVSRSASVCVLLVIVAYPQGRPLETKSVTDLISDVKQGEFGPATLSRIVSAGAVQAIPVLEEQFEAKSDTFLKEALASALVKLGDKKPIYWDFLIKQAGPAVESDAPFPPSLLDAKGKPMQGQLSPEFLSWAQAHKLNPSDAARAQMYEYPIAVGFLATTGDPRGRSLLRAAMSSHNSFIQIRAAKGLAKLQDGESIPLIIEACQKAPEDVAALIAHALVFFNDPRAQHAAEKFIPDRQLLEELRKLSREKGPDAVFGMP